MGVREERRQAAREGILAAAHRQVAEAGLASASMTTVAARAGVATGSLYRHFPSRGELLAAVVGDALRGEQALLDRAADAEQDPAAALEAWIRTTVARAQQAPVLTHALLHEPGGPELDQVREEAGRRREESLAALITAGAGVGTWPGGATGLQATAIIGACQAALGSWPDRFAEVEHLRGRAHRDGGRDSDATALVAFCLTGLRGSVA